MLCYSKQVTSQQKLGDLLTYDTPQKTVDTNGYNIPPINHGKQILRIIFNS